MSAAYPGDGDLVGAILSQKYRLSRFLGSGGMGIVYEATPLVGGKPVAVKMLRSEYLDDPDLLARFVDEGQLFQRLQHPNIARVFEVGHAEDGAPYLVMELLEGVPLASYTSKGGRVPLVQAATIMQGILAGLAYAHAQGVVHRDLKPENVILARDPSGRFTPKILDFGIAKVMDAAGGMGQKTRTGMLMGTPAYMSPEQIKNAKDCDGRSDLWSAGVMFYEMLTGRSAFPAPTEYARLGAVLNTSPPTLDQIDPQLARVSPFLQHAMQKDRALRFPSAVDMARALASVMGEGDEALSRLPDMGLVSRYGPQSIPAVTSGNFRPERLSPAPAPAPARPPGNLSGTLASPASPHVQISQAPRVTEAPPDVLLHAPHDGTLPSRDLPVLDAVTHGVPRVSGVSEEGEARGARGAPVWLVIVLVTLGLLAGFMLGHATARL